MSLYAIFSNALQRIRRTHWGNKIEGADGQRHDTGVQELADELFLSLSSTDPIDINNNPIELYNNSSGAAIVIYNQSDDTPAIKIVSPGGTTNLGGTTVDDGGTTTSGTTTSGYSGVIYADKITSISRSGCTVTISYERTTMTFVDGLLQTATTV